MENDFSNDSKMERLLLGYFKEPPKTTDETCSKKIKTLPLLLFAPPRELKPTLGQAQASTVACSGTTPPHSSPKRRLEQ